MPVVEGDPFSEIKQEKKTASPSPRDVNFAHTRSDLDSSQGAQHHTIGIQHNQASAGDHSHDGKSSRKVGQGLNLTCLVVGQPDTTRINNILSLLHNVIDFTET